MLIGIDASRAQKPNKTGVEWYAYHLIQELKKLTANGPHQWVLYSREPLTGDLAKLPENWYEVRAGWPPKYLWTQVRMSWEMLRRPVDVLFVPAHVLPPFRPEKSVVTVHDVGFRRFPSLYAPADRRYHENTTRRIANGGARIITVSEFSGREIAQLYQNTSSRRIAVTHLGVDHNVYKPIKDQAAIDDVLHKYRIPPAYFLAIGRLEAKKNTANLIKAFDIFKHRRGVGDPTYLVLAGSPGNGYKAVQKALSESPHKQYIKEVGYVDEKEKPALISGAKGLVHISWYEGFGIPPVEAMACGCPVIAANNSSMPEIIGQENALFVHPRDINATARAMDRILTDHELRETLRANGPKIAAKYTWENAAKATLPVLTDWIGA